ncbi:MAG: class I SAM-dependent methyltransferase [Gammaproteobacteria bacterium]
MSETQVLWQLLRGQPRHGGHRQRLEQFYAPQARHYDAFRDRLLPGRAALLDALRLDAGHHVVELGCGTARNLDYLDPTLRASLAQVDAVDLCPALLEQAHQRCCDWPNVHVIESDATHFKPDRQVDRVVFSYALTMMPDWRAALRNAFRMLRPGGLVGVVDFSVSRHRPQAWQERAVRYFWQHWFAHDGVWLDGAHSVYLDVLFERLMLSERKTAVPYLPFVKAPYYLYIGRKRLGTGDQA